MFTRNADRPSRRLLEGVVMKTLSWGASTMLTSFTIDKGSRLPLHHHPHEQIGCLVSGKLELTTGEDTHIADPGDSWCIPADVPHGASALETCVVIEVFSPIREDYLP